MTKIAAIIIGLALILCSPMSVVVAAAGTNAESFARLPTFTDLEIAPGGKFFAARYNNLNSYQLSVFEIVDGEIKYVYGFTESDEISVSWFEWASPDRLIVSIGFTGERRARTVVQTTERRLFALNATTVELYPLFRPRRGEMPVQIQDDVISLLPDDPDHVLVQYRAANAQSVGTYKVNITKTTHHKTTKSAKSGVMDWMVDTDGEVRLGRGVRKEEPYLSIRLKGEKKWHDFSHRLRQDGITFSARGFASDPNTLYVASNHEGDPIGLYTFNIATDEFGPLIHKHPSVDIASVRIDESTGELLSANFVDDDVETVRFLERAIREKIATIHDRFPDQRLITHSVSTDGEQAVLRIRGDRDAGRFMIYSAPKNRLMTLPPQYPDVSAEQLGSTFVVDYEARDGLTIPAYITLPPEYQSLEDAVGLPFVIRPHGGPGSRDFLRFSYTVQFLTSLGYGVLQMNFRGSTGYGQAFRDAGDREWGQAMQDDVTDGVKWLIDSKYADADRIAIAGGSYGGYVALMGAVKTPDLYQCAISFAGVSDLPTLLRYERNFIAGKYRTRFIGDLWKDRKMLAANSPARRAEEIKIPVLLMHGDMDTTVRIDQSEKMAKALKKNGKEFEFIEFEGGDHYRSLYKNRLRYLQETESLLAKCLN